MPRGEVRANRLSLPELGLPLPTAQLGAQRVDLYADGGELGLQRPRPGLQPGDGGAQLLVGLGFGGRPRRLAQLLSPRLTRRPCSR